jgi:hypothetical protein
MNQPESAGAHIDRGRALEDTPPALYPLIHLRIPWLPTMAARTPVYGGPA